MGEGKRRDGKKRERKETANKTKSNHKQKAYNSGPREANLPQTGRRPRTQESDCTTEIKRKILQVNARPTEHKFVQVVSKLCLLRTWGVTTVASCPSSWNYLASSILNMIYIYFILYSCFPSSMRTTDGQ